MKWYLWIFLGLASFGLHDYLIVNSPAPVNDFGELVTFLYSLGPLIIGLVISVSIKMVRAQSK